MDGIRFVKTQVHDFRYIAQTTGQGIGADHSCQDRFVSDVLFCSVNGFDASIDYAALAGQTVTVAASPTPHAEILAVAKEILAQKDITLSVTEFTDYVQPNNVVESGELDANYFQHVPYLDDFNAQNGTHIVSVASIHVEPLGIYGGKQTSLDAIK